MSKFIMKAGLLLVIFALSMQSAEAFEIPWKVNGPIKQACAEKWPNDLRMQRYCISRQQKAWKRIRWNLKRGDVITRACFKKWDGDYVMTEYCIEDLNR